MQSIKLSPDQIRIILSLINREELHIAKAIMSGVADDERAHRRLEDLDTIKFALKNN